MVYISCYFAVGGWDFNCFGRRLFVYTVSFRQSITNDFPAFDTDKMIVNFKALYLT